MNLNTLKKSICKNLTMIKLRKLKKNLRKRNNKLNLINNRVKDNNLRNHRKNKLSLYHRDKKKRKKYLTKDFSKIQLIIQIKDLLWTSKHLRNNQSRSRKRLKLSLKHMVVLRCQGISLNKEDKRNSLRNLEECHRLKYLRNKMKIKNKNRETKN